MTERTAERELARDLLDFGGVTRQMYEVGLTTGGLLCIIEAIQRPLPRRIYPPSAVCDALRAEGFRGIFSTDPPPLPPRDETIQGMARALQEIRRISSGALDMPRQPATTTWKWACSCGSESSRTWTDTAGARSAANAHMSHDHTGPPRRHAATIISATA